MNYSNYLMRDQAHGLIADLDRTPRGRRQYSKMHRMRSFLEITAFIVAVVSYLTALSLMT